jgi:Pyruvate/2-oxoacid:ferredoxin oxidoreductase delta subunit
MDGKRKSGCMRQRTILCVVVALIVAVYFVSVDYVQPANSCFGPCITANINKTQVDINETVTVTGQACPAAQNLTIRVIFTRPDYTYIEQDVLTDPKTGNFTVYQKLDMVGYWNIFAINGAITDRLFAQVTDPSNPKATPPLSEIMNASKPDYTVWGVTGVLLGLGVAAVIYGFRNKTMKISSFRLLFQIGLLFLIFFGIFVDHVYLPIPAAEISPHADSISTNVLGVSMPDGIPAPFFACYYPCGGTVTCALWQIQAYIYPFFDVGHGWGVQYTSTGLERLAIVFGILILAAVVLGRLFCGWVCPFGLYLDLITRLRKFLKIKRRSIPSKYNDQLHQLSYVLLAAVIIICVLFGSQAIAGTQLIAGTQKGGPVWDYFSSPFCQVCPMKPFCILAWTGMGLMKPSWIVQTTTGQFYQLGFYITSMNLIILGVVTAAAFFFRRSWCRICPLGGLMALFNRFPPFKWVSGVRLNKNEEKCSKCGICKRVCPTQGKNVYEQKSGDVASSQCIWCLRCVEMCPNKDCLQFKFAGKTVCKSRNWLASSSNGKVDNE